MAGADEGEDVVLDLLVRQAVRTRLLEKQRQEVPRDSIRLGLHPRQPLLHGVSDDAAELVQDLLAADAGQPRYPAGRLQEVERIDAPHAMEQGVDVVSKIA